MKKKPAKPEGTLAYKVFDVCVSKPDPVIEYTCGHKGCTQHQKLQPVATTVTLQGPYSNDRSLQKAGDKGSVPASISVSMCSEGWHAFRPKHLRRWLSPDQWRTKQRALWLVRVWGDIKEDTTKLCGRNIEMIREIKYGSAEAKRIQEWQARQAKREALRLKKKQAAQRVRWALRRRKELERQRRAALVARKQRAALALAKKEYNRKVAALVAKFRTKR